MDCPYRGSDRGVIPRLLDAMGVCSLIAIGMVQPGARCHDGYQGMHGTVARGESMSVMLLALAPVKRAPNNVAAPGCRNFDMEENL